MVQYKQNRHRCEIEIAASILRSVADKHMRKTWIMNVVNVNHASVKKQLSKLLGCGFITQENHNGVYELTKKGQAFLEEFTRFKRLEDELKKSNIKEEAEEFIEPLTE